MTPSPPPPPPPRVSGRLVLLALVALVAALGLAIRLNVR
jgi:hypothetical protein